MGLGKGRTLGGGVEAAAVELESQVRRSLDFALGFEVAQERYGEVQVPQLMNLALRKRPVSTEQIDSAIERIEEKLLSLGVREVASNRLGELVMRELKKLDKVAYVRFASVYRSFEDIDEFKTLVDEVRR